MRQGRVFLSLLFVLGVVAPVGAIEHSLIDFTTYNDNIAQVVQKDQELYNQMMTDTPELDIRNNGWPDFSFEASDWNIDNWRITLNSSSTTVKNQKNSVPKNAPSKQYGNVLGVRLQFHPWENSFWAKISFPYFLSPTYLNGKFISLDDANQNNGLAVGVIANVGQIKNVKSWVYGLNYDYTYGVRILNSVNQLLEFGMGSMLHEGWRRLEWINPYYVEDPKLWDYKKSPLYPLSIPYIKFDSIAFYKKEGIRDPNFIGYVKDITIDYDFAVVAEERDIDDEAIWQILSKKAIEDRITVSKRIAEELTTRKTLTKLKDANDEATATQNNNNNNAQQQNAEPAAQ
ncbi:MAG: flagellar filament outer layer protein FlaA [Brevinema sp.]